MVGSGSAAEEDDDAVIRRLTYSALAAYNADDADGWRSVFGPDFTAVDHRPASLGSFERETFFSLTESLLAELRTHRLVLRWLETEGNVSLARFSESGETLDGAEVSFETVLVSVVAAEKLRRWDVFSAEAEADARALFEQRIQALRR
jgi:hypothetical protein